MTVHCIVYYFTGCISILAWDDVVIPCCVYRGQSPTRGGGSLPEVLDEPSLDVRHSRRSGRPRDSRWSRWPRPSSGEANNSSEAELSVGRGGEIARGLDTSSGEAEIVPVDWTRRRTRQRFVPEDRSALSVVLDVPSGDGRRRARTVVET
jgi:hypothetical protein